MIGEASSTLTSKASVGSGHMDRRSEEAFSASREINRALSTLFEPSAVVELRAFKNGSTVSGYFDSPDQLTREAVRLDRDGHEVYVTINEVDPSLLARAHNRARRVRREPTTTDSDVQHRRWLPLDFDPKRPSGVSATREEKRAAGERAVEVKEYLKVQGWPDPVVGDSGNGCHLLYAVDLPNDQESTALLRGVIEALAFKFSDDKAGIDTSVYNAARIWKLYGVKARKGDDLPERPHRRSRLVKATEQTGVVSRERLTALASMKPDRPPRDPRHDGRDGFDLKTWIEEHGVPVKREGGWQQGRYRYVLRECPWNGHTDNSAYIVQFPSGAIAAGCHHDSCQGYEWHDLREHYEPEAYIRNGARTNDVGAALTSLSALREQVRWPTLAKEAFHGLPGDIVKAIEPQTEADPVAVLVNLLAAFGNAAGRGAYFKVGADTHHLKINAVLVGETSKGRKGTSWGYPKQFMHAVDPSWADNRVLAGLSSGEGFIYAVRDEVKGRDKNGKKTIVDEGVLDKRLMVVEGEFAGVLKVMGREGNTLSPVIRQTWDDGTLQTLTKNNPLRATEAHVSIIGHVTKSELLRHLNQTETANGFANRFLFVMVKRSKELPFGGRTIVASDGLMRRLNDALEFAKSAGEITWGESAKETWSEVYGPLSEGKPGLLGAVTGRAEAQVMRLAALYAAMDHSNTIEKEHLMAALALWEYAEASARYIFGDATGDSLADKIMEALRATPEGLTRTDIRNLFKNNQTGNRIEQALALLLKVGRARSTSEASGGRPVERWFAA